MNLGAFFVRSKPNNSKDISGHIEEEKVICDTLELKELVTKWIASAGWRFEEFADLLEIIGIKTPVNLSDLNVDEDAFKCLTANNKEVLISICFGNAFKKAFEIYVTEGEETRGYNINYNYWIGKDVPKAIQMSRVVKREGKELRSYYCNEFCNRTLKIDDTHILKVEIDEPHKEKENKETLVLSNCSDIENYLIGLDTSLEVSEVYETVIKMLSFLDEDIANSARILFYYVEEIDSEERVLSKILLQNGQMMEYAIMENEETFHVFKDGSWRYSSEGIKIFYFEEKKQHVFSIRGTEDNIVDVNIKEVMEYVKKKISELWKFVK